MIIDFLGQGWSFPIALDGKDGITLSAAEASIKQSIMLILNTGKGERLMRPNFGCDIQKLVFAEIDIITVTRIKFYIKEALENFEPRIKLLDVSVETSGNEKNCLYIKIEYQILSKNLRANMVYPFYLSEG